MHPLDYAAVLAYMVLILSFGFVFGRHQNRKEFFVASSSMGWLPVGLSVAATLFSSNSFVFYPSAAFGSSLRIGLSLVAFTLMTPIVVWVFVPVYSRLNVGTAYEYLERRFHVSIRTLASGLFVLLRIGWMASATYAASVVVSKVAGFSEISVIIGLGAVSIGYTMLGGLRAVMWTDVVQFFVFATTILVALALILFHLEMTPWEIAADYARGRPGVVFDFTPSLTLQYGSWAILIGVFLEAVSAFGVDQVAVQRYLSARSEATSQRGAWLNLAAMWVVIPGLLMIGVALFVYFGQHPDELASGGSLPELLGSEPGKLADQALPQFVRLHFPPGLAGLFVAALMAAVMSSIDSGIHSVTTAIVVDFRDRLIAPHMHTRPGDIWNIRAIVVVVGVLAIALACFVQPLGNVFDIGKKLTAAFGGPLLAIFVLALFSRRANATDVMFSVILATAITLTLMLTQDWFSVWYWPIGFGLALVLGWLSSWVTPNHDSRDTYWDIVMANKR